MLPHLISKEGTWERARGLGLGIEGTEEMELSYIPRPHLIGHVQEGLTLHLDVGLRQFLTLPADSMC